MKCWQRMTAAHFLLSLPAFPQNTVVSAQVETSFHGIEETVLTLKSQEFGTLFVAGVYGSWLWDSKIGWLIPSDSSPLLLALLSAETVNSSLLAQVLT